ncbi:hypothetical protein O3G_MSEX010619 [Manduca sexta]|uniref:Uncharacterized protein n=1 Tax=Manduca sexta TaxID=7130 RepID=A0A921ZHY4_MANSE|nr:hypothetical protein O3G_MSEX010619 [Manduca sexta]
MKQSYVSVHGRSGNWYGFSSWLTQSAGGRSIHSLHINYKDSPLQPMQSMPMNTYNPIGVTSIDASPSPGPTYATTSAGGFSPNRHHDIVTSTDATVTRFSFWPEGGSPSPNPGYVPPSSFSPNRRHDAITSSEAAGARFSFWTDGERTCPTADDKLAASKETINKLASIEKLGWSEGRSIGEPDYQRGAVFKMFYVKPKLEGNKTSFLH